MTRARKRKAKRRSPARLSKARLARLVEEAVVDCYNESEQRVGLYTMIADNLALPFETTVLGVPVIVQRVDLTPSEEIVAVCRRAGVRQVVPILELPLPFPRPAGAQWIDAMSHENPEHLSGPTPADGGVADDALAGSRLANVLPTLRGRIGPGSCVPRHLPVTSAGDRHWSYNAGR